MSSKLDYLSKYYGEEDEARSIRKKGKKHRKKKERSEKHHTVFFNDDDDIEKDVKSSANWNDTDEGENSEEDNPVIVNQDDNERNSFVSSSYHDRNHSVGKKRHRYDSDDNDETNIPHMERRAHHGNSSERRPKQRYDSSEESLESDAAGNTKIIKPRHEEDSDDEDKINRVSRSLSSRKHGLQSGREFAKIEGRIRDEQRNHSEAMVDEHGMGETVYRRSGNSSKDNSFSLNTAQQVKLNTGSVQQRQLELARQEFEKVRQSDFARGKDDAEIDKIQRSAIREGDPMAHKSTKRKESERDDVRQKRPMYQGPKPKPNRFGISPGFRWDGNDRGNGFEDRLLANQFSATQQKEDSYRWNVSGM